MLRVSKYDCKSLPGPPAVSPMWPASLRVCAAALLRSGQCGLSTSTLPRLMGGWGPPQHVSFWPIPLEQDVPETLALPLREKQLLAGLYLPAVAHTSYMPPRKFCVFKIYKHLSSRFTFKPWNYSQFKEL